MKYHLQNIFDAKQRADILNENGNGKFTTTSERKNILNKILLLQSCCDSQYLHCAYTHIRLVSEFVSQSVSQSVLEIL